MEKSLRMFFNVIWTLIFCLPTAQINFIKNSCFHVENFDDRLEINIYENVKSWFHKSQSPFHISKWKILFPNEPIENQFVYLFFFYKTNCLEQEIYIPENGFYKFSLKIGITFLLNSRLENPHLFIFLGRTQEKMFVQNIEEIETISKQFGLEKGITFLRIRPGFINEEKQMIAISEIKLVYEKNQKHKQINEIRNLNESENILNGEFEIPKLKHNEFIRQISQQECYGWWEEYIGFLVKLFFFNNRFGNEKQGILFSQNLEGISEFSQSFFIFEPGYYYLSFRWSETLQKFKKGKLKIIFEKVIIFNFTRVSNRTEVHFEMKKLFLYKKFYKIEFRAEGFKTNKAGFLIADVIFTRMNFVENGMFLVPYIENKSHLKNIDCSEAKPWHISDAFENPSRAFIGEGKLYSELWAENQVVFQMTYFTASLTLTQIVFVETHKQLIFKMSYFCDFENEAEETNLKIKINQVLIGEIKASKQFEIKTKIIEFESKTEKILLQIGCLRSERSKGFTVTNIEIFPSVVDKDTISFLELKEQRDVKIHYLENSEEKTTNLIKEESILEARSNFKLKSEQKLEKKINKHAIRNKNWIRNGKFKYPKMHSYEIRILDYNQAFPWENFDIEGKAAMFELGYSVSFGRPFLKGKVVRIALKKGKFKLVQMVNLVPKETYCLQFWWFSNYKNVRDVLKIKLNEIAIDEIRGKHMIEYEMKEIRFESEATTNLIVFEYEKHSENNDNGITFGLISLKSQNKSTQMLSFLNPQIKQVIYSRETDIDNESNLIKNENFSTSAFSTKTKMFEKIDNWYCETSTNFEVSKWNRMFPFLHDDENLLIIRFNAVSQKYFQIIPRLKHKKLYFVSFLIASKFDKEMSNKYIYFKLGNTEISFIRVKDSFMRLEKTFLKEISSRFPHNNEFKFDYEGINESEDENFVMISHISVREAKYPYEDKEIEAVQQYFEEYLEFNIPRNLSSNLIRNANFEFPTIFEEKTFVYFILTEAKFWFTFEKGEIIKASFYNSNFFEKTTALLISPVESKSSILQEIKIETIIRNKTVFIFSFEWSETENNFEDGISWIEVNGERLFTFYRLRRSNKKPEIRKVSLPLNIVQNKVIIAIKSEGFKKPECGFILTNLYLNLKKPIHEKEIELSKARVEKDYNRFKEIIVNGDFKVPLYIRGIQHYKDIFVKGWTELVTHNIDVGNGKSIGLKRPYENLMFAVLESKKEQILQQIFYIQNNEKNVFLKLTICFVKKSLLKVNLKILFGGKEREQEKNILIEEDLIYKCTSYNINLFENVNFLRIFSPISEIEARIAVTEISLKEIEIFPGRSEIFQIVSNKRKNYKEGSLLENGYFDLPIIKGEEMFLFKKQLIGWTISTIAHLIKAHYYNKRFKENIKALLLSPGYDSIIIEQEFNVPYTKDEFFLVLEFYYDTTERLFNKGKAEICLGLLEKKCFILDAERDVGSIKKISLKNLERGAKSKVEIKSQYFENFETGYIVTDFKVFIEK